MANSVVNQPTAAAGVQWQPKDIIHRQGHLWKIAIATWLLMAVGSATRVMNAGLACPDWPLCYGQLIPAAQMNLQVFLEWFHRLDAAAIGLSAIALLGLSLFYRSRLPKWLPIASAGAVFLIVFQGVLGGLTVTQLLRFDIVTAHLGTALLFFGALLSHQAHADSLRSYRKCRQISLGKFNRSIVSLPAKFARSISRL